jgi:acyl carrier protein phosphodiesterase
MNILAHLHLATLANSSLLGNSVADFVKGDPYQQYPSEISDGIMLHRKVDSLIDSFPEVKQAKRLFRKDYQRVAPITLDIVWDHFLSKFWGMFNSNQSLSLFNVSVQKQIQPYIADYPADYQHFMNAMWQGAWLKNYASVDFVGQVLSGMAKRRPKLYLLKDTIIDVEQNYIPLKTLFFTLYPKMCSLVTLP